MTTTQDCKTPCHRFKQWSLMGTLFVACLAGCQTTAAPGKEQPAPLPSWKPPQSIVQAEPTTAMQTKPQVIVAAKQAVRTSEGQRRLSPKTIKTIAAVNRDLWHVMRANMHWDLHLEEKRVQQQIRWFRKHPLYLQHLESRLQNYMPYLYEQTQLRGMPAELALLPVIESALDTYAFSHGGAAGPWQFVRGTATQYGLDINHWYDGRRDIVASTDAALNYLEDLHGRFDDWSLALAGYNAGQGNVNKALRKNRNAGFFDLKLPRETRIYVPRLLALVAIIKTPEKYGFSVPSITRQPSFHTLATRSQFQLDKLAAATSVSLEQLQAWNPALSQWATPPKGPHRIIVPASVDLASAQAKIDSTPKGQRVDWQQTTVRSGDTLSHIAKRHGIDTQTLKVANSLSSSRIRAGQRLLIPASANAALSMPNRASKGRTYVVRSGDSLSRIAYRNGVSLNKLMRTNQIGPKETLSVGKKLTLPGTSANTTGGTRSVTRKVHYKVRRGDSLARIAGKFNVSVKQIAKWNSLDVKRYLQPGQALSLYVNVLGAR